MYTRKACQNLNLPLNEQQLAFADEYAIDPKSGWHSAARKAGYSDYNGQATRLKNDPRIKKRIREVTQILERKSIVSKERVIEELAKIAFADLKDFLVIDPDTGSISISPTALDHENSAALQELSLTESGSRIKSKTSKIKLADKQTALIQLGKHLGLFKETIEVNGTLSLQRLVEDSLQVIKQSAPLQLSSVPSIELDVEPACQMADYHFQDSD